MKLTADESIDNIYKMAALRNTRPVRAILMLGIYDEKSVLAAANKLRQPFDTNMLLDMLNDSSDDDDDTIGRSMSVKTLKKLQSENNVLKHNMACRKCSNNEANICTLPCRHISLCNECLDRKNITCFKCNSKPSAYINVYWP